MLTFFNLAIKTFFCRDDEDTFSFMAMVMVKWTVNMDKIKWLSKKKKRLSTSIIRAGFLKTSLPYGWHCSASRRSSDWLFSFLSAAKQWLKDLFKKTKNKKKNSLDYVGSCGGIYYPQWADSLYTPSNKIGWTNESMILIWEHFRSMYKISVLSDQ